MLRMNTGDNMFLETAPKKKRWQDRWQKPLIAFFIIILAGVIIMNGWRSSLPQGTSFEGPMRRVPEVEFLHDLTYRYRGETRFEQMIFEEKLSIIESAESFIVMDFFLFNDDYDREQTFPNLSRQLTDALLSKRQEHPDMPIILITDEINEFYGAYTAPHLEELRESDIDVIITDLDQIGSSNPLYTGIWRTFFHRLDPSGPGLFPNPFSPDSPRVTLNSYLRLLNFKANHRKVLITEKEAMVTSANPHDASAFHSNIAIRLTGPIIADLLETEKAVARFSGYDFPPLFHPSLSLETTEVQAQVLTEGKIREKLLELINRAEAGDTLWIGQFYVGERKFVRALKEAADRGVEVNMILDSNRDAFGIRKIGIPNRPVATELVNYSPEQIHVRWYDTRGEQYHSKIIAMESSGEVEVIGGSANFTSRNIADKNLETSVRVVAPSDHDFSRDVLQYFSRIWENRDGHYTLDYSEFGESHLLKKLLYRFQEWSGFSTF
ncbi:MAG: phospholipase [Tindallia sp. MSAO_Bac2]|nr:MAG: phospholipase [Tindallia sp. MSAO_Bac2]